ncbi:lipid A export permease/ATP-binding protein MsbA [Desulfurivibrio alkaliphilus]|uniref:Lipid A ABC exporter, fused ATPase and inner membrane subunits MsbA n=1 Tax=Desulfurivibrio alkaliphilus (strain DSM 19089 / UNIQEM U267 / AHT2) TaxID=589865 RepID=D6Z3E0_DESAT|nr:lipid A export permease/ATP-binding protein MsbA [Desulfurivibrio alkaliphilus]ADH86065.1 lipid A ABC exporter, fused ATPase and inner membrane subunits MsbA [Desulfurivibrio alkaliphilus AHT 2]
MNNKELLLRIYRWIHPYRGRLALAMVCMVLVAAFSAAQAYMVKPVLDRIFFEHDRALLAVLPLALVLIFLGKGVMYYAYHYLLDTAGQRVIRDLRKQIFAHIHAQPMSFFLRTPTGELISRVISDVNLIQGAVSKALVGVLKEMVMVVFLVGVAFYLDWQLSLVTLVLLPISAGVIYHFGKKFRRNSTVNQQTVALISRALHETIGGQRIVKAFGMEEYEKRRFGKLVEKLNKIIVRDIQMRSLQHPVMEMLGGLALAGIIWYSGYKVLDGQSTPGTFFAFLAALLMAYEPVKKLSGLNSTIMKGLAASVRVFDLLDIKPAITDAPGAKVLPPFRERIEFCDVSFSYDGKKPVLQEINLQVPAGQVLAIVGPSGGGKTTLVNLIPRFFDVTGGQILIDGQDLRQVTIDSLRDQIAIVEQQTILFNDTVRNNIVYGDLDRSEEEILDAVRAAHAYDFIMALPEGLDTLIGEGGARLSGGQRQRLAIARALLKDAPILILDEATSALDTEAEREVQKALENLMARRTTFVIAHRLSTIKNADRVIVMQDGQIVEQGDHHSLLAQNGVYASLHQMQ